jgi:predicted lipid carrier protein YhbT
MKGTALATEGECDKAFRALADLLASVDPDLRNKYVMDRTVSCKVHDLGVTWSARLCDEGLIGITTEADSKAQIRVSVSSDDLMALVERRQAFTSAFATGKVRVQASPLDMLRLTALL